MARVSDALLRDLAWESELARVQAAFESKKIDYLLLKGAAYRGKEYARGERRSRDADLLVRPFRKACAVLKGLGYSVNVRGEAHATRPGPVPFDLDLHPGLYLDGDEGLWERAQGNRLSSPDAFVYALWHGAVRHARVDDRLLEDLSRIAESGGPGFWKAVKAELKARRLEAAALAVLPCLRVKAPRLNLRPRAGERWVIQWALKRGPRGGTGHVLMAAAARDRWRAAGRLARSGARFLLGT